MTETKKGNDLVEMLVRLSACEEAVEWVRSEDHRTLAAAWKACDRADWMLWYAGRVSKPDSRQHRQVVLAACACARTTLYHVRRGEDRPRIAIETAERWARGEDGLTLNDVRYAASAAAYAAAAATAAPTTSAAYAAASAAYAAASATAAAASAATYSASLKKMVEIVREHFPKPPHQDAGLPARPHLRA